MNRFAEDFLTSPWHDPSELHGCRRFASDSWQIFCLLLGSYRPGDQVIAAAAAITAAAAVAADGGEPAKKRRTAMEAGVARWTETLPPTAASPSALRRTEKKRKHHE